LEDALIGIPPSNVPQHAADIFDEFNCLNLNIITPHDAYDGADYPVMIYFHGGGGYVGSNSDWFCDGGAIASLAKQIGKPVVHVAIK
jgi:carboxylesterase type B